MSDLEFICPGCDEPKPFAESVPLIVDIVEGETITTPVCKPCHVSNQSKIL